MLGLFIAKGFDPAVIKIPQELLSLMGISLGAGVLSAGVKGSKDAAGSSANIARAGNFTLSNGINTVIEPKFAQIWLEEEGDQADKVVNISKYQNFLFTLVAVGFYVTAAWKQSTLPTLPENIVWLIGISSAGHVAGKVPGK